MDNRSGILLFARNWIRRKSHVQFYSRDGTKVQAGRTSHVQFYSSRDGTSEENPEKNREGNLIIKYTYGEDGMGFLTDSNRPIYVKKGCTKAHRNCLMVDHPNHLRCILFDMVAGRLICDRPDKTVAEYVQNWKFYGPYQPRKETVLPTHPKFPEPRKESVQYTIPTHPKFPEPETRIHPVPVTEIHPVCRNPVPVTEIHPVCRNVIRQMVRYVVDMHNIYPEFGALTKFTTHDIFMQENTVKYAAVPFAEGQSTRASLEANIIFVLQVIKELFGEGPFPNDLTHFFDKMSTGSYDESGQDLLDHPSIARRWPYIMS